MDKYRFAVCDDEEAVRSLISGWLLKSPYKAEIKEYDSGEELLRDIDAGINPDILFLDIAMGGADGIDTAREVGKRVENNGRSMRASRPLIIYVTGIPDRMGDAFGVKAYDYLLKPVSQPVFDGVLRRAVEELLRLDAQLVCETRYEDAKTLKYIVVQAGKDTLNLKYRDVIYVESNGRKSIIHSEGKSYDVYKQMTEFENEFGKLFFRIHRGYLVNMQHIKGYSRTEVYMDNGESLIISKYKYGGIYKSIYEFFSLIGGAMSENEFRIVEQLYGVMIIIIRGFFLQALINTFISEEIMDRAKKIVLSVVVTVEGIVLFVLPVEMTGAWTVISFLTILAVFFFYNKKVMPQIFFVYFLWLNMFFVWYIINVVLSDCLSNWLIVNMDYSKPDALSFFYRNMIINICLEIIVLAASLVAIFYCIKKICRLKRDMSWTEALFLSIYSAVSYCIAYMIAQVMVVPLNEEVFILLDEKRNLRIALPILAILIFVGEMTAIATWQRYRRLKEEDLLLQEQIREQDYLRKKIEYTEKYHDEIRTMRHDMAGKLMILKSFLENNRY